MRSAGAAALVVALALGSSARGEEQTPRPLLGVDVAERLGQQVPLDLGFTDAQGRSLRLGELFGRGRPLILSLVYYECPMLCSLVLNGLVRGLRGAGLEAGKDFDLATVSFDPSEGPALAAEKQRGYQQAVGLSGESPAWPFLTGKEGEIRALSESVGFRFNYDPGTQQFAHTAVLFVLSPQGKITRYLYGVDFPPKQLKLTLLEAAEGKIGTSFDRFLLQCYRYDPATRRYHLVVYGFLRTGGLVTLAMVVAMLGHFWRRELREGRVR